MELAFYIIGPCIVLFGFYKYLDFKRIKKNVVYPHEEIIYSSESIYKEVLDKLNIVRLEEGLSPFEGDKRATALAQDRCSEMIKEKLLAHALWTDECSTLIELGADSVGENIAYGYSSSDGVVKGWMASEGHKRNILNPVYDYIGIGILKSDLGRLWYCTLFVSEESD